jgi:hypothetical protein
MVVALMVVALMQVLVPERLLILPGQVTKPKTRRLLAHKYGKRLVLRLTR